MPVFLQSILLMINKSIDNYSSSYMLWTYMDFFLIASSSFYVQFYYQISMYIIVDSLIVFYFTLLIKIKSFYRETIMQSSSSLNEV